jgi:hypothetical protein
LDFGLFPLCSYEEIKRVYLGAECHLDLQPEAPRKSSKITSESDSPIVKIDNPPAFGSGLKQRPMQRSKTTGAMGSTTEGKAAGTQSTPVGPKQGMGRQTAFSRSATDPKSSKGISKGGASKEKGLLEDGTAPAVRRLSAKPALDTSWMEKPFHMMTEAETKAYHTLAAIHAYVRDRFQRVEDFFATLKSEIEGLVSDRELLKGLQHMHLEHDLQLGDIRQIMQVIDQDNAGHIDVGDLDKVCRRVNKDSLVRLSEEEREQRKLQSVQDSLFTKVNRHLQDPGLHQSIQEVTAVFDEACFIECILKIVMLHLNSSACSVQSVAPTYMKCLWLISFLHFSFHAHVERYEEFRMNQTRPWSQASTRPTTSQESTRPATRETNRPQSQSMDASEGSASSSRRASKLNVEGFMFDNVSELAKMKEQGQHVSYTSPLEQLMSESPNLFLEWPRHPNHSHHGTCSLCGRRPWNGWGSGMCHGCSIVDQISLHDGPLYPILERRRILRKYKDINLLGVTAEQAQTATQSVSATDSQCASSNAGSDLGSAR